MSAAEQSKAQPGPSGKTKSKEEKRKQRPSQKAHSERLKTVVRRLPPNLPEEVFWQSVQSWVTEDTVTWKEYYQGKFRKRLNKENIQSRAYIAFKDEELLATFSREYDGHVFRDKAGNESVAVVEFAPFQKVPSDKKKADPRMGTIEKDEDFISFLESLKEPTKPSDTETIETLVASTQPPPPPTTTPLLEALKAEKSAQRDKEAILRNHAHYKEIAASSKNTARKDEAKKGGVTNPSTPSKSTSTKGAEGSQPSKKAAKKAAAAAKAAQAQAQGSGQSANTATPTPTIVKNPAQSSSKAQPTSSSPASQKQASQTSPANPPKAPRAQRERGASKGAASAPSTNPPAPPIPAPSVAPTSAKSATSDATAAAVSAQSGEGAPPRRTRPVIGLASRQFEAALSGAVGGRSRREREKDKEKDKDGSSPSSIAAAGATSPKARVASVASTAPTILQRDSQANSPPPGSAPNELTARDDSAGRGRGGRPRGRGRGGRGG